MAQTNAFEQKHSWGHLWLRLRLRHTLGRLLGCVAGGSCCSVMWPAGRFVWGLNFPFFGWWYMYLYLFICSYVYIHTYIYLYIYIYIYYMYKWKPSMFWAVTILTQVKLGLWWPWVDFTKDHGRYGDDPASWNSVEVTNLRSYWVDPEVIQDS